MYHFAYQNIKSINFNIKEFIKKIITFDS